MADKNKLVVNASKEELRLLKEVVYLSQGMFDELNQDNRGNAKDWQNKLRTATEDYYDYIYQ